jgi:hypothetical protein
VNHKEGAGFVGLLRHLTSKTLRIRKKDAAEALAPGEVGRRREPLMGGREEEKGTQNFVFRGEMDDNVHGESAKMRSGRRESKECVGQTKVSSWPAMRGVDEVADVMGQ